MREMAATTAGRPTLQQTVDFFNLAVTITYLNALLQTF